MGRVLLVQILALQCLLGGLCEIGRLGPCDLLLSLLFVKFRVKFVLGFLELLFGDQFVDFWLEVEIVCVVGLLGRQLLLLLRVHLHALGKLRLREIQLSLFADALLPFLFLLLSHLVKNQHRACSRDRVRFESGLLKVPRQVIFRV